MKQAEANRTGFFLFFGGAYRFIRVLMFLVLQSVAGSYAFGPQASAQ